MGEVVDNKLLSMVVFCQYVDMIQPIDAILKIAIIDYFQL